MLKFKTNEEAFRENYAEKAHHQKSFNEKIIADLSDTITKWFPNTSSEPLKILDLCCGHGEPTYNLLRQLDERKVNIKKIVGYDNSPQQIEKANIYAKKDKRLSFAVRDAEKIEDENEYDIVISLFGLHWMNNTENVAKRINKAIKPHGKLFFFVPLEKMDLFDIRNEFMLKEEWKNYFNNFNIHPFIKNEKGYTEFFDNYFDAEQISRSRTTKVYSEEEFANFLSSWLQEVRHLASNNVGEEKTQKYALELTKSIPLNQINHNVTRFDTDQGTKVRFVERSLLYQASQKSPEAIAKVDINIPVQEKLKKNALFNFGLFSAATLAVISCGDNNELNNRSPGCNIL